MQTRHFLKKLAHDRIHAAILVAERRTSGEIRVIVHHQHAGDAVAFARREFLRLGMQKTRHRNAVLILVAPTSQTFALIGDEAVHAKCGDAFWRELAAAMQKSFAAGDYTAALVEGVERAGELLAREFPRQPGDANELSDKLIEK